MTPLNGEESPKDPPKGSPKGSPNGSPCGSDDGFVERGNAGLIVVLTGAGISRESGIDTFRDAGGLWQRVNVDEVATPEGFAADPVRGHAFYNELRRELQAGKVKPNPGHIALAELERFWQGDVIVVTQNIDDLHERAGTRNLIHMHGELLKGRCSGCNAVFQWPGEMSIDSICPVCQVAGRVRPHIVWFGEVPLEMAAIFSVLDKCRFFLSIGTSGNVYPAAGFVERAKIRGKGRGKVHTVELNLEPSQGATLFDERIYGPASQVVPAFVKKLVAR